jgi:hypothetical protein
VTSRLYEVNITKIAQKVSYEVSNLFGSASLFLLFLTVIVKEMTIPFPFHNFGYTQNPRT